jgi:hypothetical protein
MAVATGVPALFSAPYLTVRHEEKRKRIGEEGKDRILNSQF